MTDELDQAIRELKQRAADETIAKQRVAEARERELQQQTRENQPHFERLCAASREFAVRAYRTKLKTETFAITETKTIPKWFGGERTQTKSHTRALWTLQRYYSSERIQSRKYWLLRLGEGTSPSTGRLQWTHIAQPSNDDVRPD